MLVLVAKYHVKQGKGDEVVAALEKMSARVEADEPGCTLYQVCRSADDSNFLLLYEQYTDEAALAAHRETPHFREIIEETIIPLLIKREREFYELVIS